MCDRVMARAWTGRRACNRIRINPLLSTAFLSLLFDSSQQQQPGVTNFLFNTTGFACSGCLAVGVDGPAQIRAMYFEKPGVVQNDAVQRIALLEGIPHDCASQSSAVPQCFRAEHWDKGWVGELFFDIVQETGGEIIAMTAANFSALTVHASADELTRCAWEVQLGLVDVCVADVWETDARRIISPFTSPIDIDVFKLVTKSLEAKFRKERLLEFAKPFDLKLWVVTVCTAVLGALLAWVVDDSSRQGWWIDTSRRGRALAAVRWPARRLVLLGYSLFALLLSFSYLAWLSKHMTQVLPDMNPGLVSSIADAISTGRPLCMLRSSVGLIQQPGMKVEAVDSVWKALENIQSNRCVGAVIGKDDYLTYVSAQSANYDRCPDGQTDLCLDKVNLGECLCTDPKQEPEECPSDCPDYHRFCDLFQVSDPDLSAAIAVGLPVRDWLQDILSAWIVKKRLNGDVEKLRRLYIEDPNPPICDLELKTGNARPISLEGMAGIFVLSGSLMLFGFLWHQTLECIFPSRDPVDAISVGGGNYRVDRSKRGLLSNASGGYAAGIGPNATEFRLEALGLVDNMKTALEQSTSRSEERLIRQEERIVRQDRKLDELRAVVDDLNGKLGTEMAEETQNYETQLSVAVARLKVSEEELLDKQREVVAAQGAVNEREKSVTQLQLQLQEATMECINMKQMVGERVGEIFELKQRLAERDGEIHQLKEARVAATEELMHVKGQLGEKTGQVHELRQQSEETRAELEQTQGRLHESLADIMRLKMQMDLQIELHAERELELSNFAGSNAGAAHELRQQNEERWSELQRLREGAGERAGEMFELRQALSERTEEIIDLKGQLGERAWELLEMKQQLGERAGDVLAANGRLKDSQNSLDECRAQCQEWRWQAQELRKEMDEQESKLTSLTRENASMFGDNAELRKETRRLQEIASGHANDKLKLSEEMENMRAKMQSEVETCTAKMEENAMAGKKVSKEREEEIAELKLLVGQHVAEVLDARTLLQDRCREIVQLEAKIKEKEEHIDILKTETAARALELEEQRQQMSVLWDLGGKVQSLLEMDLGNKMQHMSEILEKVDVVLAGEEDTSVYGRGVGGGEGDSREMATGKTNGDHERVHTKQNHLPSTHSHTPTRKPQNAKLYEASNTYAPDTIVGASQSMEASLPVPPIAFKPPQNILEWNQLTHQMTPRSETHSLKGSRSECSSHQQLAQDIQTPHADLFSPSDMLSPRSARSHASSNMSYAQQQPGHRRVGGVGREFEHRVASGHTDVSGAALSHSTSTTYY